MLTNSITLQDVLLKDITYQMISFASMDELVSLAKTNKEIAEYSFGMLKEVVTKSVNEFLIRKPKHSFPTETQQRCFYLIFNSNKFEFSKQNQNVSVREAAMIHSYLQQTILFSGIKLISQPTT